jgi:FkbH-like protein
MRLDQIASHRINWDDKASNLQAIADELSVGIDSLVFVDDNPVERRWVRMRLPSVTVVELPPDPYGFADAIRSCPLLERLSVTAEDQVRPELYVAQRRRSELQAESGSVEEFLTSLQMAMRVETVDRQNLARAAQLTQRTNQFNVTTIRRNEAEISQLAADPSAVVFLARLTDRFGDNGIIGLAIARAAAEALEIDTLLMSCRVIGRGVETAMLGILARIAQRRGLERVHGVYVATPKNAPAADLFERHGFTCTRDADGKKHYVGSVDALSTIPAYLEIAGLEHIE